MRQAFYICFVICFLVAGAPVNAGNGDPGRTARNVADLTGKVVDVKRGLLRLQHEIGLSMASPDAADEAVAAPESADARAKETGYRLGNLLLDQGLYPEAIAQFRKLLTSGTGPVNQTGIVVLLADALYRNGDAALAERQMWDICDRDSFSCKRSDYLLLLAKILLDQNRSEEMKRLVSSSLRNLDHNDEARTEIGILLYRNNIPVLALEIIKDNVLDKARILSARILTDRGDIAGARKVLDNINKNGVYGSYARYRLGWLEYSDHQYDRALQQWSGMGKIESLPVELMSVYLLEPYARWLGGDRRLAISAYRNTVVNYQNEYRITDQALDLVRRHDSPGDLLKITGDNVSVISPVPPPGDDRNLSTMLVMKMDSSLALLIQLDTDLRELADIVVGYRDSVGMPDQTDDRLSEQFDELSRRIVVVRAEVGSSLKNELIARLQEREKVINSYQAQARYLLARMLDQYNMKPDGGG